ncbi:MAG: LytR/AlgR family response regulator transcription factor [Chitinophagales bacterium]
MNILIVEDEAAASRRLKKMISEIYPDAKILSEIDSVESAVNWFTSNPTPDLIFMDIQLADGNCFDIFKRKEITAPVIFITAYDEFAIRAFEVNAIGYLLKPVKVTELENAMKKLLRVKSAPAPDYQKLLESIHLPGEFQKRLLIKIGQSIRAVEIADIAYFFTQDKIVTLVNFENRKYPTDYTLDELEEVLNPDQFFRINRQFIINNKAIREMYVISKSRVKVILHPPSEMDTAVSAERSANFKKWLTGKAV